MKPLLSIEEIERNITSQLDSINLTKKNAKKKKKNKKEEDSVQQKVVSYMNTKYSDVIYKADTSTGGFTTIGMVMKNKRLGGSIKNFPDFTIFHHNSIGHALFLELKKEGVKIYKEDGTYYAVERQKLQSKTLKRLQEKGYSASFAIGFLHAKELIDLYMQERREEFLGKQILWKEK